MVIFNRSDFGDSKNSGGATGSGQAKHNRGGWYGQVKNAISFATWDRRAKALGLDTENFAELIAANIAKVVIGNNQKHLVPEVSFVVDDETRKVGIVSKYIDKADRDLLTKEDSPNFKDIQFIVEGETPKTPISDEYLRQRLDPELRDSVDQDAVNQGIKDLRAKITITKEEKQAICDGIALSILVGDHDVNPGNFLKLKNREIARIDYGHAFNDLISMPSMFGGQVRNKENQVLDFFNRQSVNSRIGKDATPKLWRNFENLIPSIEMANSLLNASELGKDKVALGVEAAKKEFNLLLATPGIDKKHVLKSLVQVANNTGNPRIKVDISNEQATIDAAFAKIQEFSQRQALDMEKAAHIMKAQVELDEIIKAGVKPESLAKWKVEHEAVIENNNNITWIKSSKSTPAIKGDVETYIKESLKRQGKNSQEISSVLPEIRKIFPKQNFIDRIKRTLSLDSGGDASKSRTMSLDTGREAMHEAPYKVGTQLRRTMSLDAGNQEKHDSFKIQRVLKSTNSKPPTVAPHAETRRGQAHEIS